jgi:hypothetical protein
MSARDQVKRLDLAKSLKTPGNRAVEVRPASRRVLSSPSLVAILSGAGATPRSTPQWN